MWYKIPVWYVEIWVDICIVVYKSHKSARRHDRDSCIVSQSTRSRRCIAWVKTESIICNIMHSTTSMRLELRTQKNFNRFPTTCLQICKRIHNRILQNDHLFDDSNIFKMAKHAALMRYNINAYQCSNNKAHLNFYPIKFWGLSTCDEEVILFSYLLLL